MSHTEIVKNVPDDEVPQVKTDYESQGATVTVTSNGDKTSNVTATFPDLAADHATAAAAHASAASAHAAAASALVSAVAAAKK